MLITGACHCGNIAYTLDWQPDPTEIPARACTCSFCLKHGGIWTSKPEAVLRIRVKDEALVSKYRFGTATADFHVCSRCGAVPMVTCRMDERLYAVVNVNTFDNVAESLLRRAVARFDGEDATSRLARRRRNWIADVAYV